MHLKEDHKLFGVYSATSGDRANSST